jgi:hypothetical protein
MKKKLLLLLLVGSCATTCFAQNYFLGTSADGVYEYYILNATVDQKKGVTEVFSRIKPVEGKMPQFREQEIQARTKQNLSTEGFDKLAYYRRKIQYSCKSQKCRIVEVTYYDAKGKEIDKEDRNDKTRWDAIPAGTMREMEFKRVCNM